MKRLKKILKSNIFAFVIGAVIFSVIGASAATILDGSQVQYTGNKVSGASNIQQAIDGLYDKVSKTNFTSIRGVADATRFVGADVDNYVSFNNGELWRIIGVYGNNLKIIKATSLPDKKQYNASTNSNAWEGSDLQIYLNQETEGGYYYSLSNDSKNMIEEGTWYVGAVSYNENAEDSYNSSKSTIWNGKVGLMEAYEYLYAADLSCWKTAGASFSTCSLKDWLKPSAIEWTLNPEFGSSDHSLIVAASGIGNNGILGSFSLRPVVYLKSNVVITSGEGTTTKPYILALNQE